LRAERENLAVILTSEGQRDSVINTAEGEKQRVIKESEARKMQQINEAEGQGQAILTIASATAEGIRRIASAIQEPGGLQAVNLRVAEQYITQFGNLAKGQYACHSSTLRRCIHHRAAMKIVKDTPGGSAVLTDAGRDAV
jgi:regulator of protease activity HflC (stomatin/prohibitin superfamily)